MTIDELIALVRQSDGAAADRLEVRWREFRAARARVYSAFRQFQDEIRSLLGLEDRR